MILERYRRDYTGEFVITETTWRHGIKHQDRAWVENPIKNHAITGYAAVIGSNADRDRFDHTRLQYHRGGIRASRKLITYGTGEAWRDMRLDYYVTTEQSQLDDICNRVVFDITLLMTREMRYHDVTKVYTNSTKYVANDARFLLLPHSPQISDLAMPIYLAAFDGNREIYILGYSKDMPYQDKTWVTDIAHVMMAYPGTKFILVGTGSNMPNEWVQLRNVSTKSHREFVTHCDV